MERLEAEAGGDAALAEGEAEESDWGEGMVKGELTWAASGLRAGARSSFLEAIIGWWSLMRWR